MPPTVSVHISANWSNLFSNSEQPFQSSSEEIVDVEMSEDIVDVEMSEAEIEKEIEMEVDEMIDEEIAMEVDEIIEEMEVDFPSIKQKPNIIVVEEFNIGVESVIKIIERKRVKWLSKSSKRLISYSHHDIKNYEKKFSRSQLYPVKSCPLFL